jgi:MFS family permease
VLDTDEQVEQRAENATASRRGRLRDSRALAAWKSLPYRRYIWVSTLGMAGRALQTTLIGYLVYDLTGSNFLLGLVSFMQSVPGLVLAPFVGVIVDRFDRRRILAAQFGIQGGGLLALAVLAIVGALTVPAIAATVVVMGIAAAFSYPAGSSLLPSLVPIHDLQSATASNQMLSSVSRIAIPALAGYLVDVSGVTAALLLGVGLYAPAAVVILFVPLLASAVRVNVVTGPLDTAARSSVRSDITDAISYIRSNRLLRAAIANDIIPYMFGMSYIALLPAIAQSTLHGNAATLGLLYGATGAGAVVGTLIVGMLSGRAVRGPTIWLSMIGFGVGLLVVAVGSSQTVIMGGLVVVGMFQSLYAIQSDTLVLTFAEDRFRGRAVSAQAMVNGLMPIGFLVLGAIAELTTTGVALGTGGVALVLAGMGTFLFRPVMRDLR